MSLVSKLTDTYLVSNEEAEKYVISMEGVWRKGLPLSEVYGQPSDACVRRGEAVQKMVEMKIEETVSKVMYKKRGVYRLHPPYTDVVTGTSKYFKGERGDVHLEYDAGRIFPNILGELQVNGFSEGSFEQGMSNIPLTVDILGSTFNSTHEDISDPSNKIYEFLEYVCDTESSGYVEDNTKNIASYSQKRDRAFAHAQRLRSSLFEDIFLNTESLFDEDEKSFKSNAIRRQVARNEIARYGSSEVAMEVYTSREEEADYRLSREDVIPRFLQAHHQNKMADPSFRLSYYQEVLRSLDLYGDEEPFIP